MGIPLVWRDAAGWGLHLARPAALPRTGRAGNDAVWQNQDGRIEHRLGKTSFMFPTVRGCWISGTSGRLFDSDKGSGINQSELPPILSPAISWATPKHRQTAAGACATSASRIEAKSPAVVGESCGLSVTREGRSFLKSPKVARQCAAQPRWPHREAHLPTRHQRRSIRLRPHRRSGRQLCCQ